MHLPTGQLSNEYKETWWWHLKLQTAGLKWNVNFINEDKELNLKRITFLPKAALALSLVSALQMPSAFAADHHLRGATCAKGGNPSVSLVNEGGRFTVECNTGGGDSLAGVVVKDLEKNPIVIKNLDASQAVTAVIEIRTKEVIKTPENIEFRTNLKNDVGKVFTAILQCDTNVNNSRRKVPLKLISGNTFSASLPKEIFLDLAQEVPALKLSENSQIVGITIDINGERFRQGIQKIIFVNSVAIGGKQLPVKLENVLGCDAFPAIPFKP